MSIPLPKPEGKIAAGNQMWCVYTPDQMHAHAAAVSAAKDERIKVLEDALRGVMGYAWCEYRSNSRPHFDRVYAAARAALGDKTPTTPPFSFSPRS